MNYLQNLWNALDLGSLRDTLLRVAAVLICLIIHETCHGVAAFFLGDPTAKRNHRLSLNPLRHIDWIGLAAMVLTGVNLDASGKPTRWKIENSWGDKSGDKGYYVCSDSWFDQYVFQAAVEKEYLGNLAALASQEPIVLEPWDPMGTLAD